MGANIECYKHNSRANRLLDQLPELGIQLLIWLGVTLTLRLCVSVGHIVSALHVMCRWSQVSAIVCVFLRWCFSGRCGHNGGSRSKLGEVGRWLICDVLQFLVELRVIQETSVREIMLC